MQIAVEQGLNSSQAMYSISPLLVFVFLLFLLPDASLLKGSPRPLFWTSSACVYHYLTSRLPICVGADSGRIVLACVHALACASEQIPRPARGDLLTLSHKVRVTAAYADFQMRVGFEWVNAGCTHAS